MDPQDEVTGVFDAIETENTAHDPIEDVSDTAKAEGSESEAAEETQKQESEQTTEETGTPAEGQPEKTEETKTEEHSKENTETQTSENKTETETKTEQDYSDWQSELPPPPQDYQGKQPEYNDDGQITNMTPQEYQEFLIGTAAATNRKENYNNIVEGKALEVAEKIIPGMKTNKGIQQMVRDTRLASIMSGEPIDSVQAAIKVRDLLGIAPEKIQAARDEGASQTKASITVQKAAALETPTNQTKDEKAAKDAELTKRIQRGDNDAFAELLSNWEDEGKI